MITLNIIDVTTAYCIFLYFIVDISQTIEQREIMKKIMLVSIFGVIGLLISQSPGYIIYFLVVIVFFQEIFLINDKLLVIHQRKIEGHEKTEESQY